MHITSNRNLMELFHQKTPPIQSSLTLLIFFFFSRFMSSKCIYSKKYEKRNNYSFLQNCVLFCYTQFSHDFCQ